MPGDRAAERLRTYLTEYARRNPQGYKFLDHIHLHRDGLPQWPDFCYVPLAAAVSNPDTIRPTDPAIVTALAAWRMGQGLYRFDPDVLREVWDTPVSGDIPSEVLFRLPEWCVYIEAPPGVTWDGRVVYGAFAHLEWDTEARRAELRLVLDAGGGLMPLVLHLGGTLDEGLASMVREAKAQAARRGNREPLVPDILVRMVREIMEPLASCLIYICSETVEYAGEREPGKPAPKKVKGGEKLFHAEKTTVWDVGVRMGAARRRAREVIAREERDESRDGGQGSTTGRTVRPHLRKAHHHHFWVGPRDGERRLVIRWLPPIPVKLDVENMRPVVVHPVE